MAEDKIGTQHPPMKELLISIPLSIVEDRIGTQHPPRYLEVYCTSSRTINRFANGTTAGFAVSVINRKLRYEQYEENKLALYIEAVREGQESIVFGPDSLLVDYGDGWMLQTVSEAHFQYDEHVNDLKA